MISREKVNFIALKICRCEYCKHWTRETTFVGKCNLKGYGIGVYKGWEYYKTPNTNHKHRCKKFEINDYSYNVLLEVLSD